MSFDRVRELRAEVQAKKPVAIVVLGAGVEPFAPEYGVSSLLYPSLERLRYGLWLARETGAPVAFSGGVGLGQPDAAAEAKVAAKIAAEEFNRPLRWQEEDSRDTRENATRTLALLKPARSITSSWSPTATTCRGRCAPSPKRQGPGSRSSRRRWGWPAASSRRRSSGCRARAASA